MNWKEEVEKFKSQMKPVAPSLSSVRICFGFFGTVGGGKSVTAGVFAVGITPEGMIGWIDGEGRRSGYAIDQVAEMAAKKYGGGKEDWIKRFVVIHVDPPFNPLAAVAAIETLEELGCKTIICDLMSQCWDSEGGYLDMKDEKLYRMAGDDEAKRQRSAAAAAANIKPWTHGKLVNKVNSSKANLVLLFQAKAKFNAKTSKPDSFVTPIQESGLTRTAIAVGLVEAKMVGELPQGGFCTFSGSIEQGTKFTHHAILSLLPKNGEQFRFEHAEAIAKWCNGNAAKSAPVKDETSALKKEIWTLTTKVHFGDPKKLFQHLVDENYITPEETLESLNMDRLRQVLGKLKAKATV